MPPELVVPDTFSNWLRQKRARVALPALGFSLPAASAGVTQVQGIATWPWLLPSLLATQLLIIGVLLFLTPEPLEDPNKSPRASAAVRQFARAWKYVWFFWFLEFLVLTGREFAHVLLRLGTIPASSLPPFVFDVLAPVTLNLANNLPTIALVMCYIVASERTVDHIAGEVRERDLPWHLALIILITLTVLDILVHTNQYWPQLPVATGAPAAFGWVSGLSACLATALLVGRLDSKLINLPTWVIVVLYGYAAIQPGWPTFDQSVAARALLLNVALAMKFLFFLLIYWLYSSGVFLFYIDRVSQIWDNAATDRSHFLARVQRGMDFVPAGSEPDDSMRAS